ncbi:hypothetical protein [Streptosporangium sp. NPDC002524]|uniref:hypothetical protein n=1 Tax=Streptosporangium sp. NPDC002524 TaxID=3154537 RepID=UPI0033211FF4
MAKNNAGDLSRAHLATLVRDLQARVKSLELQIGVRAVTFVTDTTSASGTTYARMAWSSLPRSGSTLTVDVSVTLSGASCDVQLRADGTQIGVATVTTSGTVTLTGFLPPAWEFGSRKVVDVQARVPSGSATVALVGAWHR